MQTDIKLPAVAKIDALIGWPDTCPNRQTMSAAKTWLCDFYDYAHELEIWIEPNITVSPDADIVFEWWHHDKKLTVYVSENGAEYIKVWGLDIFNDMEDGIIQNGTAQQSLWAWLMD